MNVTGANITLPNFMKYIYIINCLLISTFKFIIMSYKFRRILRNYNCKSELPLESEFDFENRQIFLSIY